MTEKLKIGMRHGLNTVGGAERVFVELASGFCKAGHEVYIYAGSGELAYSDELPPDINLNVITVRVGWLRPKKLFLLLDFILKLRRQRPHLLFSTGFFYNIETIIVGLILGTPVIIRETTTLSLRAAEMTRLWDKLLFRAIPFFYPFADCIIAPSEGVKQDLENFIPKLRGRVRLIPNPLDLDEIHKKKQRELPIRIEGDFILAVGRLVPIKGYDILIKAWAEVYRTNPLKLVILGTGYERKKLFDLAAELEVESALIMPGFDPNPYSYMSRAKLFVLSSYVEGLPNSLLQAMACGCPVVAMDCKSGPREILQDGMLGYLVPVGDAKALASVIIKALQEPIAGQEIELALERYKHKDVIARYCDTFNLAII